MPRFDLIVPRSVQDRLIDKLGLSADQQRLVALLQGEDGITETARYSVVSGEFARQGTTATGIDGVKATLAAGAAAGLELAVYAPGSAVVLGGFELPPPLDSRTTLTLPADRVACGLELEARLTGSASAAGGGNWQFALQAAGEASARLAFFKEAPASTKARELAVETAGRFRHAFDLVNRPPEAGETVVVEYRGQLKLGATLDYGWNVRGTRKQGVGLEDLELAASYRAAAKLSMQAGLRLEKDVRIIVRPSERTGWVNVALHKQRERDASFAMNLSVDARLRTHGIRGGVPTDASALVDVLLDRTPLPDLAGDLRRLRDEVDPARVTKARDALVRKLTDRIRGRLEGPVGDLQAVLDKVEGHVEGLIRIVEGIDDEIRELLQDLLDRFPDLSAAKQALDRVATATDAETLLDGVLDEDAAARVREVLAVLSKITDRDLTAVNTLNDHIDRVRGLVARYEAIDSTVLAKFEEHYVALRKQIGLDHAIDRVREVLANRMSVDDLLDEKIAWLETYLRKRTARATGTLSDVATEVRGHLTRLVEGYEDAVEKARGAVQTALNRELGLQLGVAWNSVSEQQALVSVDLNLGTKAGKDALQEVMRGDLEHVMTERLRNADSIRLRKSYLLDRLQRSLTVRAVVNGRESQSVTTWLASKETFIEATEDGEIWVQRGQAGTRFVRERRRSMLDVSTMLHVSVAERFRVEGRELRSEGVEVQGLPVRFQYREVLDKRSVTARTVVAKLKTLTEPMTFLPVVQTSVDMLAARLAETGRSRIGPVTIEARCSLAPTALASVMRELRSDLQARVLAREAWDMAIPLVFSEIGPDVVRFYEANKDRTDVLAQTETDPRLNMAERFACVDLIHTRARFQDAIADLRQHVFVNFRDDLLDRELRELATLIGSLRVHFEGMRNLILTVFALMVLPADRQGSVSVTYRHPVTDEPMEWRVDSRVTSPDG